MTAQQTGERRARQGQAAAREFARDEREATYVELVRAVSPRT
ncbi:hypothetical protein [Nocardioides sp.]|nr:hypothetical protein [Nocardioides sp.]